MEKKGKIQDLLEVLQGRRRLLILTHNNPDPDSIASAHALKYLVSSLTRIRSQVAYGGTVERAENLEMIRLLGIDLKPYRSIKGTSGRAIALVDVQPGGRNTPLHHKTRPSIVIDHHNLRKASQKCPFRDIRTDYGSCGAILTEYIQEAGLHLTRKMATALYYGIKTDTSDYARDIVAADIAAMQFLFPNASLRLLHRIENPRVPRAFYARLSRAVESTLIYRDVVVSVLDEEVKTDFVAQMADYLIRTEGIKWALVCGPSNGNCIFSIRSMVRSVRAGNIAQRIAGRQGSGGGHMRSAGGSVSISNLENTGDLNPCLQIAQRFLKALKRDQVQSTPLVEHEKISKEEVK